MHKTMKKCAESRLLFFHQNHAFLVTGLLVSRNELPAHSIANIWKKCLLEEVCARIAKYDQITPSMHAVPTRSNQQIAESKNGLECLFDMQLRLRMFRQHIVSPSQQSKHYDSPRQSRILVVKLEDTNHTHTSSQILNNSIT